jgi:hypothetical protein
MMHPHQNRPTAHNDFGRAGARRFDNVDDRKAGREKVLPASFILPSYPPAGRGSARAPGELGRARAKSKDLAIARSRALGNALPSYARPH